jgi:membrane-associated phospholipid phosphatase
VCGAFPSLHVGWPTILTISGGLNKYLGIIYIIWISIAAIYSSHHWIIDVLSGILFAIILGMLGKYFIEKIMNKN